MTETPEVYLYSNINISYENSGHTIKQLKNYSFSLNCTKFCLLLLSLLLLSNSKGVKK